MTKRLVGLDSLSVGARVLAHRERERMGEITPDGKRTFREVRNSFLGDVATVRIIQLPLAVLLACVRRLRETVNEYPAEFTDEALPLLDRLQFAVVVKRLEGKIEG